MALESDGGASGGGEFGSAADMLGGAAPAGGSDGGAAGGGGGGAGGGAGGDQHIEGAPDPEWWGLLSADVGEGETSSNRDVVKAKAWKSPDDMMRSYREAERAVRDSGRIKVPGEGASAEETTAFHRAIGVPETADGYELPKITGQDGKEIALDDGLLGKLRPDAHALGVPAEAFKGLVEKYVEHQMAEYAEFEDGIKADAQTWVTKQGAEANAKLAAIDQAGRALGLTSKEMVAVRNALGAEKSLDMFARLGQGMAEDVIITGGTGRFGINGREAQAEIDALKQKAGADPVYAQAVSTPGTPEFVRFNRLVSAAASWQQQQLAQAS